MSGEQSGSVPEVTHVDDVVLRDLESKYSTVSCPVHNVPPTFEVAADGSVVERMCCEALSQIIRELQANESAGEGAEGEAEGGAGG
ncbi:MAG TPA: hypothetical protein VE093_41225 [Polyangiaceae bacterium]|jgi:hypothetical protein|nr:hypothetical protein [Polyangiaceae bacterium]